MDYIKDRENFRKRYNFFGVDLSGITKDGRGEYWLVETNYAINICMDKLLIENKLIKERVQYLYNTYYNKLALPHTEYGIDIKNFFIIAYDKLVQISNKLGTLGKTEEQGRIDEIIADIDSL